MQDRQSDSEFCLPTPIPVGGAALSVSASFLGVRGVPLLALAHNKAFPRLVLYPDYLEYRILFKRKKSYEQIEEAWCGQHFGGSLVPSGPSENLYIKFKRSIWVPCFLIKSDQAKCVIKYLADVGVAVRGDGRATQHL